MLPNGVFEEKMGNKNKRKNFKKKKTPQIKQINDHEKKNPWKIHDVFVW